MNRLPPILAKLAGGDRRSVGRANEVAAEIEQESALFAEVFEGLFHEEPLIRMRAADALTKAAQRNPALVQPYKERLLHVVSLIPQQEVQWHVAELFGVLELDDTERAAAVKVLLGYLDNAKSNIVRVNALQTLADFALRDEALRPRVMARIEAIMESDAPSLRSRGRKLLSKLQSTA